MKISGAALVLALMGCGTAFAADSDLASPKYGTWGYDASGMDRSVSPGADFNKFANGAWEARTAIPSDRSRYGNFDILSVLSENRVHAILEDAAAGKLDDPDAVKIGAAYKAFMDEKLAETLDAKPLAPALATIHALKDKRAVAALMGKQDLQGTTSIFGLYISQDAKSPNVYAVFLGTGGLGLPDRDYYLKDSFAAKKKKYEIYAQDTLERIGWKDPAGAAAAVLAFETKLADASWTRAQRRDRDKTYNPVSLAGLKTLAPGFDWDAFLKASELPRLDRFIVTTNTAFPTYAKIFGDTPLDTVKAYLAFHAADKAAPMLSHRFADASFEFHQKELGGQPEQQPRWKRGVTFVNEVLGESVGRIYVARYFPPSAKVKMDALVNDIRTVLEARIEKLDWMTPPTKVKALEKLSKFTVKIAYPAKWRDYGALKISATDLVGDAMRSNAFEWRREKARLFQPVDHAEWGMTPQTVNAYYNYANNEIVFPAAILAPPFFDPDADPAINYGGIGGVIGHEISHGFDDQGRKSDGDGVLTDWWTSDDADRFKVQTARLGAQYSAFEPLPGAHVVGDLTMGENIGDMGGVSLALDAYHASLHGKPAPVIDGFTGDQRVFLGWAQVWRQKQRDDALRRQVVSDPHSPAQYRVNGTIRNVAGWYQAFGIKPGDPMYIPPEQRVHIW